MSGEKKRIPEVVECSKCKRRLDPAVYQAFPDSETPAEIITRIEAPLYPYFSVQCATCGQYTIFTPRAKK
jgi:hypothetical protein